jgi:hypothetical protein
LVLFIGSENLSGKKTESDSPAIGGVSRRSFVTPARDAPHPPMGYPSPAHPVAMPEPKDPESMKPRVKKLLLVNFFMLLVISLAVELGGRFVLRPRGTCFDEMTHHINCPGGVAGKTMSRADGGRHFYSYMNRSGFRVKSAGRMDTVTSVKSFKIINIGDSFLEQKHVSFEQTIGQELQKLTGLKTADVGASSWAPANILGWLGKHPPAAGTDINVFTFNNDFFTGGGNLYYHDIGKTGEDGFLRFSPPPFYAYRQKSFFYRSYRKIKNLLFFYFPALALRGEDTLVPGFERVKFDTRKVSLGLPELYRSPKEKVAPFDHQASLPRLRLRLLGRGDENRRRQRRERSGKNMQAGGEKNYAVRVIFIPSPWSIEGENLLGKEFYYLEKSSALGNGPLYQYMASRLSCPAVNLAPVIREIKNRSASPQKFYFNFDGHWTSYAHREIARWIASQFYRTEKN